MSTFDSHICRDVLREMSEEEFVKHSRHIKGLLHDEEVAFNLHNLKTLFLGALTYRSLE